MPRALTEKEKNAQYRKLLDKGKKEVLAHGIKKVSVDDIAKVAGIAKGTFYQYFESKETYLAALIEDLQRQVANKAEMMLGRGMAGGGELRNYMKEFLKDLLALPEMAFFAQNEHDIEEIFQNAAAGGEGESFKQMEVEMLEKLLKQAAVDTKKAKPGVVHNYLRLLGLAAGSDLLSEADLPETLELLNDTLIFYIFRGTK